MQPIPYRSNSWMMWPVIIVILAVIVLVSGLTLNDSDLVNGISARAQADQTYAQTQQQTQWFNATLPLELEKATAETRDFVARLEEARRVERLNNDRIQDAKRLATLGGIVLLLLSGAATILILGLLAGSKALNSANREEAVRRDLMAVAEARAERREPAATPPRPRRVVNTPQPMSAVRAGLVQPPLYTTTDPGDRDRSRTNDRARAADGRKPAGATVNGANRESDSGGMQQTDLPLPDYGTPPLPRI